MNKGLRIAVAVVVLAGTLLLARGQMAWAGGLPDSISRVPAGLLNAGAILAPGQTTGSALTATLSEISGPVQVKQAGESSFSAATPGYVLKVQGQVQTGTDGKVRLDLSTGSIVRVGPNTHFTLQVAQGSSGGALANFQLSLGKLWVTLTGGEVQVETASGVAAVKGSLMTIIYIPPNIMIYCIDGHCSLTNQAGTAAITGGQSAQTDGADHFPKIGPLNLADTQDWLLNNPGAGGPAAPSAGPGTVRPPGVFVPAIGAQGIYSVGGVCTFRIIEALHTGYSLSADLLPFASLGKNPAEILSDLAGVCRAEYTQTGVGIIDSLGTNGQVEICFASVPNTKGVIYVYNPYQTATGPANPETYTALPTTPDGGLLCAPAQQTGKYFLASVKP